MARAARSLFWKEWRESTWRLVFGCLILAGFAGVGLRARILPDEWVFTSAVFIAAIVFPLFLCMGLLGTEQEDGTRRLLLALPASPAVILGWKLLVGSIVVAIPIALLAVEVQLLAGGRELPLGLVVLESVGGLGVGESVLIWTVAFGAGRKSEMGVALSGVLVFFLWYLLFRGVSLLGALAGVPPQHWLYYLNPFTFWFYAPPYGFDFLGDSRWPLLLLVQAALALLLLLRARRSFSRLEVCA